MSKRTSEGERCMALMLAEQQATIDVSRVRVEQLRESAIRLTEDCERLLAQPPFMKSLVPGV